NLKYSSDCITLLQLSPFDNSNRYRAAIWLIVQIDEMQAMRSAARRDRAGGKRGIRGALAQAAPVFMTPRPSPGASCRGNIRTGCESYRRW
ncbi:hypothetical protein, partial [Serratia marcescens]|uniref:hypothetical protein n=1 Tax=Serratia marcescens TaxID=615 RepID=UPI001C37DA6C